MHPEIKHFLDQQGKSLTGFPFYRLTWSDAETEWRRGTFNDFFGDLFLRQVTEVRLVPKYPYVKSRWILEKWFPPEKVRSEELVNFNQGSYEPIFVFQDKDMNPLPVVLKVVELLVGYDRVRVSSNPYEEKALAEKLESKEFNELLDSIDTSVIQSQLHMKEAIIKL